MKKYEVTITETLQKVIEVEATSLMDAELLVQANWEKAQYILDAECFSNVVFKAKATARSKNVPER